MKFLGGCPLIKMTIIIADMKWIPFDYLRRFMKVKPKNQKEGNHENFAIISTFKPSFIYESLAYFYYRQMAVFFCLP